MWDDYGQDPASWVAQSQQYGILPVFKKITPDAVHRQKKGGITTYGGFYPGLTFYTRT